MSTAEDTRVETTDDAISQIAYSSYSSPEPSSRSTSETPHATFYGKAAIGFHAEAIHAGRFNPVLYISYSNLLRLLPEVAAPVDYAIDSDMAFGRDEPADVLFAHLLRQSISEHYPSHILGFCRAGLTVSQACQSGPN